MQRASDTDLEKEWVAFRNALKQMGSSPVEDFYKYCNPYFLPSTSNGFELLFVFADAVFHSRLKGVAPFPFDSRLLFYTKHELGVSKRLSHILPCST